VAIYHLRPAVSYTGAEMNDLQNVIKEFAEKLTALIEGEALTRARTAVLSAFGVNSPTAARRGRPPKAKAVQQAVASVPAKKARRKLPKQFCPVPGCKNPAAPVFGMVCADHKGVAKSKIRKYREDRRAKKVGAAPRATRKRATKKAGARKSVAASNVAAAPAAA
jgi:hypothetical protein